MIFVLRQPIPHLGRLIVGGVYVVIGLTFFSAELEKAPFPLAYDSGGVTTSTVTVPRVTALGLGLAASIPGKNPALDGFGLIAFASLFPMIAVIGCANNTVEHQQKNKIAGEKTCALN